MIRGGTHRSMPRHAHHVVGDDRDLVVVGKVRGFRGRLEHSGQHVAEIVVLGIDALQFERAEFANFML
jgi:hypothetical protein